MDSINYLPEHKVWSPFQGIPSTIFNGPFQISFPEWPRINWGKT